MWFTSGHDPPTREPRWPRDPRADGERRPSRSRRHGHHLSVRRRRRTGSLRDGAHPSGDERTTAGSGRGGAPAARSRRPGVPRARGGAVEQGDHAAAAAFHRAATALVRPRAPRVGRACGAEGPVAAVERDRRPARSAGARNGRRTWPMLRSTPCRSQVRSDGSGAAARSARMSSLAELATRWADGAWDEGRGLLWNPPGSFEDYALPARSHAHGPAVRLVRRRALARGDARTGRARLPGALRVAVRPSWRRVARHVRSVRRVAAASGRQGAVEWVRTTTRTGASSSARRSRSRSASSISPRRLPRSCRGRSISSSRASRLTACRRRIRTSR